ncbi:MULTISPECIES: methyltransferase [Streptomyces]|uniref:methyltransferase n=1 Tax=Streptomyces TaxID=1883 RepID=UPI001C4E9993|nr:MULTISPECIES: methyltransferase [Streptomyces]MCL6289831.1 acetylserotonin O-methyltransferase [Streptomyces sp. 43Y-GA-1]MCX4713349.1 acetylserotonin O-methyltransferase [Streptomyces griseus]QXQ94970.1 methyltransferase [Streptomyces sp. WY228]
MTGSQSQETGNGRETAVDWQARGTVARLVLGQMATQALGTAVRLGVFDRIGPGELSGDTLAGSLGTHPQATLRLLRALAGLQLLSETEPGVFRTTTAGDALRADTPGTMVAMARMFTDPVMLRGWDLLDESVRTGETTFDTVFGTDFFGHLKEQPELSAAFNEAMSQGTRLTASNVPHHFDFGRFRTLVDIGGGDGTLLASVLRAHPELRGVLFDTAEGLAQAPRRLAEQDVTGRVVLETGDFFASAPAGGDLYLLKSIIHDWDDERCAAILRRIRAVIPDHGSLLIVEPVLPATVPADPAGGVYLSDLNMLVNVGGRERTEDDFAALCAAGGFALRSVTPLPAPDIFRIIEASPV